MCFTRFIICLGLMLLSSQIPAQKLLWSDHNTLRELFHTYVCGIGDVDGDGYGDLVVDRSFPDPAQPTIFLSVLEIRSGRNGEIIRRIKAQASSLAPAGDVDKDGVPDFIVGREGHGSFPARLGSITVFSGKTGSVIHSWTASNPVDYRFGWFVSGGTDINRDGYPDYIGGGRDCVIVFSGKDGSIIHRIDGLGGKALILGDVNGDGHPDLLLGDSLANYNGVNSGSVHVLSGKDLSPIYRLDGQLSGSYGSHFGRTLIPLGDVDRDGVPDFAVGSNESLKFWSGYSGSIEIISGKSGRCLLLLEGENPGDRFGWVLAAVGDTNGDGYSEFMTISGSPNKLGPDRFVLLSHTGQVLRSYIADTVHGYSPNLGSGSVAGLGDVDGDGLADFAMMMHTTGFKSRGIEVHAPFGAIPLSANKSMLSLSRGESLMFWLNGGLPLAGQWYALLGSMTGTKPGIQIGLARLPLQPDPYFHLTMGHGGGLHQYPLGSLDPLGRMTSTFKLDPRFPTELIGLKLHHAFLGFSLTPPRILFGSNPVETEIIP